MGFLAVMGYLVNFRPSNCILKATIGSLAHFGLTNCT